jgi:hypothetical protein
MPAILLQSLLGFEPREWPADNRRAVLMTRGAHRHTVTWSACKSRSASNSSTSRYEREKRKYQPTANRMTSGSNSRHLNRPQTEDARRSIQPAYHGVTAKLQHFRRRRVWPELPLREIQEERRPPDGSCFVAGPRSFPGITPRRGAPAPGPSPKSPAPACKRARPLRIDLGCCRAPPAC